MLLAVHDLEGVVKDAESDIQKIKDEKEKKKNDKIKAEEERKAKRVKEAEERKKRLEDKSIF